MSSTEKQRTSKIGVSDDKLLNITDASAYLDTSRHTTWRVIKHNKIKTFENPLDLRETLVSKNDLDHIKTLLRPKGRRRRVSKKQSFSKRGNIKRV
jgi:hypothetical protein